MAGRGRISVRAIKKLGLKRKQYKERFGKEPEKVFVAGQRSDKSISVRRLDFLLGQVEKRGLEDNQSLTLEGEYDISQ